MKSSAPHITIKIDDMNNLIIFEHESNPTLKINFGNPLEMNSKFSRTGTEATIAFLIDGFHKINGVLTGFRE